MKTAIALAVGALALTGCAHRKSARGVSVPPPPPAAATAPESTRPTATTETARNKTTGSGTTAPSRPARTVEPLSVATGVASWYGHPYHGRPAANGEIYDMEQMTAAHRTLPFDTVVRVTNLANQKSVEVRINDRGPFVDGRIIDLSHAAAREIEMIGPGTAEVRMEIVKLPDLIPSALFAVQVGAFHDRGNAERERALMEKRYGSARLVKRNDTPTLWRVLVGREKTEDAAGTLKLRIRKESGERNAFVVRLDS
jgi:rare lipoprotein A